MRMHSQQRARCTCTCTCDRGKKSGRMYRTANDLLEKLPVRHLEGQKFVNLKSITPVDMRDSTRVQDIQNMAEFIKDRQYPFLVSQQSVLGRSVKNTHKDSDQVYERKHVNVMPFSTKILRGNQIETCNNIISTGFAKRIMQRTNQSLNNSIKNETDRLYAYHAKNGQCQSENKNRPNTLCFSMKGSHEISRRQDRVNTTQISNKDEQRSRVDKMKLNSDNTYPHSAPLNRKRAKSAEAWRSLDLNTYTDLFNLISLRSSPPPQPAPSWPRDRLSVRPQERKTDECTLDYKPAAVYSTLPAKVTSSKGHHFQPQASVCGKGHPNSIPASAMRTPESEDVDAFEESARHSSKRHSFTLREKSPILRAMCSRGLLYGGDFNDHRDTQPVLHSGLGTKLVDYEGRKYRKYNLSNESKDNEKSSKRQIGQDSPMDRYESDERCTGSTETPDSANPSSEREIKPAIKKTRPSDKIGQSNLTSNSAGSEEHRKKSKTAQRNVAWVDELEVTSI